MLIVLQYSLLKWSKYKWILWAFNDIYETVTI